jgi:hypothetical protein
MYERTLLDSLGLSYKNLVTLPWELTKMSFVYDWFANIGDLIGSLVPAFGLNQIGSCTVVERKRIDSWVSTGYTLVNPSVFTVLQPPSPCSHKKTTTWYTRSIGLGAPSLAIKLDFGFDKLLRSADAAALLAQRMFR